MKTWITIFFLIFVTWFLDQMGWLKPLLVFTSWGLILLVFLFFISLIARPRFFRILKESILDVTANEKHKKQMQELEQQYQDAVRQTDKGNRDKLLQIAKEKDIGDAWFKLATILAAYDLPEDQTLATEYFQKAVDAKHWLQSNQETCILEWEKRLFFGIGCKPEYLKLMANWEQTHFPGYQRESELAWLYANAKDIKQDFEKAWYWLMLGKARWSDNKPAILPENLYTDLYADLEKRLTKKSRLKLESSANDQAYQEFVSSR